MATAERTEQRNPRIFGREIGGLKIVHENRWIVPEGEQVIRKGREGILRTYCFPLVSWRSRGLFGNFSTKHN